MKVIFFSVLRVGLPEETLVLISKMEYFAKIVSSLKSVTIFAKSSILDA